jgi:hypothetical protein
LKTVSGLWLFVSIQASSVTLSSRMREKATLATESAIENVSEVVKIILMI